MPETMGRPSLNPQRQARSWVMLVILAVLMAGAIPYGLGYLSAPPGTTFIGYPYPTDTNRYFNEMLQGARHGVLFSRNYLTLEAHPPAFIFHFYMALGRLAALTGLEMIAMFHLARLVFGAWLLGYCYAKSRWFFRPISERMLFLILLGFSCGFQTVTEANVFQSITLFPHFAASKLFMVAFFFNLVMLNVRRRRRRTGPLAVCVAMIVLTGLTHPWNLIPMGLVSAGFLVALSVRQGRRVALAPHGLLVAVAGGILGVHGWTQATNPVFGAMARSNVMRLDHWLEIVNAFGLLWVGAGVGAILALSRARRSVLIFPLIWCALTVIALLIPTPFQRRFLEGLHIPVALLAASALWAGARRLARRWDWPRRRVTVAAGVVAVAATIPFTLNFLYYPNMRKPHFMHYPDQGMVALARWMDAELPEGAAVMAGEGTAQFLIRFTLLRVYAAHSVATLDFFNKRERMVAFYSGRMSEEQMRLFVERNEIEYVVYGPYERFSEQFRPHPRDIDWLEPVWGIGTFFLYRVAPDDAAPSHRRPDRDTTIPEADFSILSGRPRRPWAG